MTRLGSLKRTVVAAAAGLPILAVIGAATASAGVGVLPPKNPSADCDASAAGVQFTLQALDVCRAKEHVGPLVLPSNFAALNKPDELLVLIDLERVNRGLEPIVGLSGALNRLAAAGARAGEDPPFPHGGYSGAGGIWFGGSSVIAADYGWMYDDGPKGLDLNADCPRSGSKYCWLHRDIILWKGPGGPLIGGGGYARGPDGGSYAFEVLSGYKQTGLKFTWAHELRYFARKPGLEPLRG